MCDRLTIEKMVKDLMEVRRDELYRSADKMAKLVTRAVSLGGSSHSNLDPLIQYIRLMRVATVPTELSGTC